MQAPLLHAARTDPKARAIKEENLHPVSSLVGEQEQMPTLRVLLQLTGGKSIQAIEPEPHVRCASGHEDARGRAQTEHALYRLTQAVAKRHSVERRNQPQQLVRIKARPDLDAKTIGE